VVAPVPTTAGTPWLALDGHALLLYPYVEGGTAWSGGLTDAQWIAHGGFLRALHDAPQLDHLAPLVPPEAYACETTRVRAVPRRVDGSPGLSEPARALAALWHTHRVPLADLLDRADRLTGAPKDRPGPSVLCHADLHGGNILVDADGGLHVVDWDEAVRAPRECDLLFVLGGHFGEQPVTPHREALFRRGYGPVEVDPARMAYYRHARVVDDLAEFAEGVLDGGAGEASRLDDLGWLRRLLAPAARSRWRSRIPPVSPGGRGCRRRPRSRGPAGTARPG
jgi:spectinomycin phosphotransferase